MKRILAALFASTLFVSAAFADENVRAAQTRLKEAGFYFGEASGTFDNETSAAISRYQIRNGLQITGQLDAQTAKSLGMTAAAAPSPAAAPDSGSWQRLRKTDRQFIERRETTTKTTRTSRRTETAPVASPPARQANDATTQTAAPATSSTRSVPATSAPEGSDYGSVLVLSQERLRDYIAAFVLAGLDPRVGAELEFFADRVSYYDQGTLSREKIRADLQRYNRQWPQRRFWLAGEIDVEPQPDSRVRVTFPLRYELRNGSKRASGTVRKTLLLEVVGDDLQIVRVSERKMR